MEKDDFSRIMNIIEETQSQLIMVLELMHQLVERMIVLEKEHES